MLGFAEWTSSEHRAVVLDMTAAGAWEALAADYAHRGQNPALQRVLEIAREHDVVCIVKEPRYIDADWRSQLARFYTGAFRRYPSVCHRLHFFTRAVPNDLVDLSDEQPYYRGYTVLRPLPVAPVGRTMIARPTALDDAARCEGTETVDLVGWPLTITAMPFISQDTQYLRCAHAAVWMVLAHGRLVHGLPRYLPGHVHDAAAAGAPVGRQLPSDGLSGFQLFTAMQTLGLSPTSKRLKADRAQDLAGSSSLRLYSMVCRYVNSMLPPIITSTQHAWVLVAYQRRSSNGNPVITLWRHDDARGPYLRVDDPWNEPEPAHRPWMSAYLPLLPKAHLDAERAEAVGRDWFDAFGATKAAAGTALETLAKETDPGTGHTFRTYLTTSTAFKQDAQGRGVPAELAAAYRLAPMSRLVWVIELVDRNRRGRGEPDVIGEVILDATLTQFEPDLDPAGVISMHVDSFAFFSGVDRADIQVLRVPPGQAYATGCNALHQPDEPQTPYASPT